MTDTNNLCDLWKHTLATFFKHVPENDAKSLSKAPCLVALNMYLTLHLLFFG